MSENVELLANGKADLAIVQLDALKYLTDVVKAQIGVNVLEKIKVVLNLYHEEIHILSNKKDIAAFYHLEGKRGFCRPARKRQRARRRVVVRAFSVCFALSKSSKSVLN